MKNKHILLFILTLLCATSGMTQITINTVFTDCDGNTGYLADEKIENCTTGSTTLVTKQMQVKFLNQNKIKADRIKNGHLDFKWINDSNPGNKRSHIYEYQQFVASKQAVYDGAVNPLYEYMAGGPACYYKQRYRLGCTKCNNEVFPIPIISTTTDQPYQPEYYENEMVPCTGHTGWVSSTLGGAYKELTLKVEKYLECGKWAGKMRQVDVNCEDLRYENTTNNTYDVYCGDDLIGNVSMDIGKKMPEITTSIEVVCGTEESVLDSITNTIMDWNADSTKLSLLLQTEIPWRTDTLYTNLDGSNTKIDGAVYQTKKIYIDDTYQCGEMTLAIELGNKNSCKEQDRYEDKNFHIGVGPEFEYNFGTDYIYSNTTLFIPRLFGGYSHRIYPSLLKKYLGIGRDCPYTKLTVQVGLTMIGEKDFGNNHVGGWTTIVPLNKFQYFGDLIISRKEFVSQKVSFEYGARLNLQTQFWDKQADSGLAFQRVLENTLNKDPLSDFDSSVEATVYVHTQIGYHFLDHFSLDIRSGIGKNLKRSIWKVPVMLSLKYRFGIGGKSDKIDM